MLEQPSPDLHHASVVARVCVARDSSQVATPPRLPQKYTAQLLLLRVM